VLFRVFDRGELPKLFSALAARHEVIGPVRTGSDHRGDPIFAFEPVSDFSDLHLSYTHTKIPAKKYFLPFREELASFRMAGGDWTKESGLGAATPRVFLGLHACDINALNKLDKVLAGGDYPMPCYAARRRNMFIVGVDCEPQAHCFCRSMGADTALSGFDLFLTTIGDRYFAEILSNNAFNLLRGIRAFEVGEEEHVLYRKHVSEKNRKFRTRVDTTDLTKILDMEFDSPVWKGWGEKCLSCGSCAAVCPTCYCYGVEETADIDLSGARKTKTLYSCNLVDFAEVAGGHNFRPESHSRLKYRYYHKHRGFVEAYEESLCTGCGRCGEACLAGINVPDVIASVRGEEEP
jgi:sulfhydrogenase subunit beta (sulfur reductase)